MPQESVIFNGIQVLVKVPPSEENDDASWQRGKVTDLIDEPLGKVFIVGLSASENFVTVRIDDLRVVPSILDALDCWQDSFENTLQ